MARIRYTPETIRYKSAGAGRDKDLSQGSRGSSTRSRDAENGIEVGGIAWFPNRSSRSFLGLACLVALLMTFGLPAAADGSRQFDGLESSFIEGIGEFRPDLAKKIWEELPKVPNGRESAEYLNRRVRTLEKEIKVIRKVGNKKQLENATFARAILYEMIHWLPDSSGTIVLGKYNKEWDKKTKEERREIIKDKRRAAEELKKIRKARKAAEAKRRKAAEEKKRKEAEEKKRKAAEPSGDQRQGSLGPGQSPSQSTGEDPRALLNALAAALDGLQRREQVDVVTPTGRNRVPSALAAAQGAVQERQDQLIRAQIVDRERRRDREAHRHQRDQREHAAGRETGTDTGTFEAGRHEDAGHRERADATGAFEGVAPRETGDSTGIF